MTRLKGILLVASSLLLLSCNPHFSDVVFDANNRAGESELFGDDFSETSPPVFFNNNKEIKFFKKYPFDKGGYAIVGLPSESEPNDLQQEMGEFFTDDVEVLNEFKRTWSFSKESVIYACDYHYTIYVTHHGNILESFAVNLNNNIIVGDKGQFYFDSKKLSQFKDRLKKPTPEYQAFNSFSDGRAYFFQVINDKNLLLAYIPVWMYFEGKFTFTFKNSDQKCEPQAVEKKVRASITKKFPGEQFQCAALSYSTSGEYEFEITCKKSLFEQFDLYRKEKDWEPYEVSLVTYWKK